MEDIIYKDKYIQKVAFRTASNAQTRKYHEIMNLYSPPGAFLTTRHLSKLHW